MARRRSSRGFSSARRRTGWEEGPGGWANTASITTSSNAIVGVGLFALLDGLTLVRVRGEIELGITAAAAALDGFKGAFGICIVSADAFAVGVTAIPTPLDDADWNGWLWHQFYSLTQAAVFSAQIAGGSAVRRITIDSKAMRKINVNEVIVLVGEHIETGTAVMQVAADSRLLFKLP